MELVTYGINWGYGKLACFVALLHCSRTQEEEKGFNCIISSSLDLPPLLSTSGFSVSACTCERVVSTWYSVVKFIKSLCLSYYASYFHLQGEEATSLSATIFFSLYMPNHGLKLHDQASDMHISLTPTPIQFVTFALLQDKA